MAKDGEVTSELSARIAKAARAFGCEETSLSRPQFITVNQTSSVLCHGYFSSVLWSRNVDQPRETTEILSP